MTKRKSERLDYQLNTQEMVRLRLEDWSLGAIANLFKTSRQAVYQRIAKAAPDLISGKIRVKVSNLTGLESSKLRLVSSHAAPWTPPKTGSASGFIRPLPLDRLCSGKARP